MSDVTANSIAEAFKRFCLAHVRPVCLVVVGKPDAEPLARLDRNFKISITGKGNARIYVNGNAFGSNYHDAALQTRLLIAQLSQVGFDPIGMYVNRTSPLADYASPAGEANYLQVKIPINQESMDKLQEAYKVACNAADIKAALTDICRRDTKLISFIDLRYPFTSSSSGSKPSRGGLYLQQDGNNLTITGPMNDKMSYGHSPSPDTEALVEKWIRHLKAEGIEARSSSTRFGQRDRDGTHYCLHLVASLPVSDDSVTKLKGVLAAIADEERRVEIAQDLGKQFTALATHNPALAAQLVERLREDLGQPLTGQGAQLVAQRFG